MSTISAAFHRCVKCSQVQQWFLAITPQGWHSMFLFFSYLHYHVTHFQTTHYNGIAEFTGDCWTVNMPFRIQKYLQQ